MPNFSSQYATGTLAVPTVEGSEVVVYRSEVAVPATLALNDILEMGALPADHLFADLTIDSTDLDTNASPTIVLQFGFLNEAKTGLSQVLHTTTVAQAGGIDRVSTRDFLDVVPSTVNRPIGFRVSAAGATRAAGRVGLTVDLRTAP